MSFVYPAFLFALTAIAIPIIIHLFNFRRYKRVAFSNVRFLREVREQTKAQSELKHLLVLLARILAISALVFAFAQPFLVGDQQQAASKNKVVSVYLDNSFSMNAVSEEGNLFELGRQYAGNIAEAYSAGTEFQLLTNDFSGKQQRLYTKEGLNNLLDEAGPGPNVKNLQEVVSRQKDALSASGATNRDLYIITDGQAHFFDIDELDTDSSTALNMVHLAAQTENNSYIDSCWFPDPVRKIGQPEELHVSISNKGQDDLTGIPVRLFINNNQKSLATIDLQAGETKEVVLSYTLSAGGNVKGRVEISDYPVTFDDQLFFSYSISESCNILTINKGDSVLNFTRLFKTDPYFKLRQQAVDNLDYATISKQQFIILNGVETFPSALVVELTKFLESGGSLVYFPPEKGNTQDINKGLNTLGVPAFGEPTEKALSSRELNFDHLLYRNVFQSKDENLDLPSVQKHYPVSPLASFGIQPLLSLENGDVFLAEVSRDKGKLYFSTVALADSASNFKRHALFVPTLFQMALNSFSQTSLFHIIGNQQPIKVQLEELGNEEVLHLVNESGSFDVIPEVRRSGGQVTINLYDQVEEAGNYLLKLQGETVGTVAFNYDRSESTLNYLDREEIETRLNALGIQNVRFIEEGLDTVTRTLKAQTQGTPLWHLFVVLALVFLFAEMALLRFWK